jgi:hypothetical protein
MVKKYHLYENNTDDMGGKIALTILLVIALSFFEYWLAILSCSISCNGMPSVALAVFIGGTISITAFKKQLKPNNLPLSTNTKTLF